MSEWYDRQASGPLRVHPDNPRYFCDPDGRAVYLTGSHTWGNMQDQLSPDPGITFDYDDYVEWMADQGFTFMRGWAWEQAAWDNHTTEKLLVHPLPYQRTGPGTALDGEPRFDLTRFNEAYFERLRSRAIQAGKRGIYVSLMLFEGFSVDNRNPDYSLNPWPGHPFHRENNVNGIDGDPHETGGGRAVHTLALPEVTAIQEAYVRHVVDVVNDLDNVLFEIGNEHYADSAEWQIHVIDLIHHYEAGKAKQHPVGMTSGGGGNDAVENHVLFESPADWISPRHEPGQPYRDDPPANDGRKVILTDTDHLWGLGATQGWVWKSLARGLNPILMDPYEPLYGLDAFPHWGTINRRDHPLWAPIRRSLSYTAQYARRIDLAQMIPAFELSSTGYCLAHPGHAYLVYAPDGGLVRLDLEPVEGTYEVEWFSPAMGEVVSGERIVGGKGCLLGAPFAGDAVLYVKRAT